MKALVLVFLLPVAAAAESPGAACGAVRFERAASWSFAGGVAPQGIGSADVDGDGRDDLILRFPGSGPDAWRLWKSRPDGTFEESGLPLESGGSIAIVTDLDGDSDVDLLARSAAGRQVLRNDGSGRFTAEPPEGPAPGPAALGDLDGDGRADLVWTGARDPARYTQALLYVAAGDGRGGFGPAKEIVWETGVDADFGGLPVVGDFDGDGHADVLVGISYGFSPSGFLRLFRGDGTGGLVDGATFGQGGSVAGLAAVDLDRDGRPEIVRGARFRLGNGSVRVISGSMEGFRTTSFLETGPGLSAVVPADFNGDRWTDLLLRFTDAFSTEPSGRLRVVLATKAGDLLRAGDDLPVTGAFVPADLEGSGRAGVVLVLKEGGEDRLVFHRSVCSDEASSVVLPVAVRTVGATGARFGTELTLLNAGAGEAHVEIRDGASWAGEPVRTVVLGAAKAVTLSTAAVGEKGLPLGSAVGPLSLSVRGIPAKHLLAAARVVSETPGLAGRGTLGIEAFEPADSPAGVSWIPWLAQDDGDRSNLAVLNPGSPAEGDVTVRVTVVSTDPEAPGEATLEDAILPPGGFRQWDRVLRAAGLAARSGFARLERVSTTGRYDAYAVLNDAVSSDGSFLRALPDAWVSDPYRPTLLVPVALSSDRYETELVLFNAAVEARVVELRFFRGGTGSEERRAIVDVPARGSVRIPNVLDHVGAAAEGGPGGLEVRRPLGSGSSLVGVVAVARTRTRGAGGRYGVATVASTSNGWIRTARLFAPAVQDGVSRTNLTLVVPENDPGIRAEVRVRLFDAEGRVAATRDLDLRTSDWTQLNSVFSSLAPGLTEGWIHVGSGSPAAAVVSVSTVNDGAEPGQGSGDGAVFLGASR
ncbi:MAG: VCBS repeat-containing protein [Thermoanaerobaculia bacterium]|nr:VCBS repeat-containing protein [Thermoanaerobaculia bacterium]